MEQSKIEQIRVEVAVISEFASMATSMAMEEEYSGIKRVLSALESHLEKLKGLVAIEQPTEKKSIKR